MLCRMAPTGPSMLAVAQLQTAAAAAVGCFDCAQALTKRSSPNFNSNPNLNPSPNPSPNPTVAPAGLPAHVARLPPVHRGVRPARRHAAARGASARRGVSLYQGGGGGLRCSGTRYTFRRWPACVAAGQAAPGVRTHALLHKYTQCWCPRDVGRRVRFQSGHLGVNFTTLLVSLLLSSSRAVQGLLWSLISY